MFSYDHRVYKVCMGTGMDMPHCTCECQYKSQEWFSLLLPGNGSGW